MRLSVTHETVYRFETPASRAIQTLRLTPRNTESQLVHDWRIDVSQDCRLAPVEDAFGNLTHTFSIDGPIDELSIVASGVIVTEDTAGVLHRTRERLPLAVACRVTDRTGAELAVRDFAASAFAAADGNALATLHALMERIHERITIDPEAPQRLPAVVLAEEKATLADTVHLFLAAARALDIPARCVAGHLFTECSAETETGHLWIEAHVGPQLGWIGFDATQNCCPTDRWIRIAVGLDALDVTPIRGVRTSPGAETVTTRIMLRDIGPA